MYAFMRNLDKRWIYLLMSIAIGLPILLQLKFPETPTKLSQDVFDEVERLQPGDRVLLAFDFDNASEGELGPMATAFVKHCAAKKVKMYFLGLWPVGPQMADDTIKRVIQSDYPNLVYGQDYVNLGYKSGNEGVIKVIVTDLRALYTTDKQGTNIDRIAMCKDVTSVQDMDLVISISAGNPGSQEWVRFAAAPYPDKIKVVAGSTGVQSAQLFPYLPKQLRGLLGAIKGAAEYEKLVVDAYGGPDPDPKYLEGQRRMGPQLIAHVLMILLIITGNVIYFVGRARGDIVR